MHKLTILIVAVILFELLIGVPSQAVLAAPNKTEILDNFGKLPLYFIENQGQLDSQVRYYLAGKDKTLYFTPKGLTFALTETAENDQQKRHTLKLDFIKANPKVELVAEDLTPAIISYFKGNQDQWKTRLKTYSTVRYQELWPGIDLSYTGTVNKLKYEFIVQPGADPTKIQLAYRGASTVQIGQEGQLQINTPIGGFEDQAPYVYQEINGQRIQVAGKFKIASTPQTQAQGISYGFDLGAYDKTQPLIIDPTVILYAGYIGGSGGELGSGIAVDSSGAAYVIGSTASTQTTFPATVGPDLTYNGTTDTDVFVAKVNASGSALVYAGYIGGSGMDRGRGIAVDSSGAAYVTGDTLSTQTTFPATVGPDLTQNGLEDAFVAKVAADGASLTYAGYIGGSNGDLGRGIAVDSSGAAYVTGDTLSTQTTFPATVGPDLTQNGGADAFVAKVNSGGTALTYAGYIGGSNGDQGYGIAVDSSGAAYVTGYTVSTETTFPATVGPDLTQNGFEDAFVAKVAANGASLTYAGYIGGSGSDEGYGIAVDSSGAAYVTGYTVSSEATFPAFVGPDLTYNDITNSDAFVAKVSADGAFLTYAGYIGGSSADFGRGIAVDSSGAAYVTGDTASTEISSPNPFPLTDGPDLTQNGGKDAFVAKVNSGGTALTYAGYIGGSSDDLGYGIAVDSSNNAYITGEANSTEGTFPDGDGFGTVTGPDLTQNGGTDAFVAKVGEEVAAVPEFTTTVFFTMLLGLLIIFFMKMRQFRTQALRSS